MTVKFSDNGTPAAGAPIPRNVNQSCADVNQSRGPAAADFSSLVPTSGNVNHEIQKYRNTEKRENRDIRENERVASQRPAKPKSLEDQAVDLALALADKADREADSDDFAEWRLPFVLARRLRTIANDRPKRFRKAVAAFAERMDLDFDEAWMGFLNSWDKVVYPEGFDIFSVAAERARTHPLKVADDIGDSYAAVASLAYHLADLTKDKESFCLPRKRIGEWLGKTPMTVSRIVSLLVRNRIIEEVDGSYSYAKKKAKTYRFIGTR